MAMIGTTETTVTTFRDVALATPINGNPSMEVSDLGPTLDIHYDNRFTTSARWPWHALVSVPFAKDPSINIRLEYSNWHISPPRVTDYDDVFNLT